ncbi:transglycosylase SLT domain-containing protein [Ideonella sp. B7]|uniref:transglycosylase SLT domain-containing protein n=1 Tax=Ideonella benzenivorans TaxID=2831643 RepID=UPI001CED36FE|nr:transglycosylase SLT domain-containing protein [Ideonella benzenivorans]MCA6216481.1 transglycosylase SLT domain-containing protein [Ideonella benzenivorans]
MRITLSLVAVLAALLSGCATTTSTDEGFASTSGRPALASGRSGLPPLADLSPALAPDRRGTPLAALGPDGKPAALTPVDPLDADRPVDTQAATAQQDLWQRVRNGFAMPDLDNDLVHDREAFYARKPDYLQRMTERGGRYLYHVVSEIEKRHMPTELALLPFVESAFNPHAVSTAKASGMWQFVPATGKTFDLKQNIFRDDRRDVLASTRAALDYLQKLYGMFNDWHLALAAYNWGEGSVQKAIKRNEAAGLPTDYESLRMPQETRYYVPKLQAIKNIIAHPDQFAIALPSLKNHPYFLSVPLDRDIDVSLAAKLAGVSMEEFRQLNPQVNKPVMLAAGTDQLLLPYDAAARFVSNLQGYRGQLASWTAWVAPRTLRPAEAAKLVGMDEDELRSLNRIPAKMLVKAGSTLLVPRSANRAEDVSAEVADSGMIALAPDVPPLRKVSLTAGRKGETVAAIARRYKLSTAQVAQWNKTSANGRFKRGTSYVLYLPTKAADVAVAKADDDAKKSDKQERNAKADKSDKNDKDSKSSTRKANKADKSDDSSDRKNVASRKGSSKVASRSSRRDTQVADAAPSKREAKASRAKSVKTASRDDAKPAKSNSKANSGGKAVRVAQR